MWGAKFLSLFFVSLLWSRRAVAKVAYACTFSEDVKECSHFQNKYVDVNEMKMKGDDNLGVAGTVEIKKPLETGYEMCTQAWRITELGNVLVFNACEDICENLKDTNSPWYPIFKATNITVCPIESKIYDVDDITIDLGFAKDVLTYEFCAEYLITMAIMKGLNKISCHQFIVTIFEYEEDE